MKNDQIKLFEQFGLNENEAKVYLSMLETGHTSILKISQNTEIKRTSLYVIIENLINKDLVKVTLRGKKKLYIAEDPEVVLEILKAQKEKFKVILPELDELYKDKSDKPFIKFYEGKDGIRVLYKKIRNSKNEILWLGNAAELVDEFPEFNRRITKYSEKHSDFPGFRQIVNNISRSRGYAKDRNSRKELKMKIKVLPKDLFFLNSIIVIYENKLLITSIIKDYFSILIESKTIADSYRQMFELAWQAAKFP